MARYDRVEPARLRHEGDFPLKEALVELGRRLTAGSPGEASIAHAVARRMPTPADLRPQAQTM